MQYLYNVSVYIKDVDTKNPNSNAGKTYETISELKMFRS